MCIRDSFQTGQGSALVGILDAFMDSKGIVTPETFRGFCAPVVSLALMDTYCYSNKEELNIGLALTKMCIRDRR